MSYKDRTWSGCIKYRKRQREAKEQQRLSKGERLTLFFRPPKLRRVVIVIDFDWGKMVKFFKFYRTERIDSYNIIDEDGNSTKAGWNNFLKILSKCYPSVRRVYE